MDYSKIDELYYRLRTKAFSLDPRTYLVHKNDLHLRAYRNEKLATKIAFLFNLTIVLAQKLVELNNDYDLKVDHHFPLN